jgi:hypothetical protein
MDGGVVWSGKLANTLSLTDDINDDYASIGTLSIGCMGPMADLWVDACSSSSSVDCAFIDIKGDAFGEVHVPELASGQTIRVGGRFGNYTQAVGASATCDEELPAGYDTQAVDPTENSPRGFWAAVEDNSESPSLDGVAAYARILIQGQDAMHGQIILNGYDTSSDPLGDDYWLGDVLVGSGDPNASPADPAPKVYSTDSGRASSDRLGLYYDALSTADGGGAVGVVEFMMHGTECDPPNGSEGVCEMPTRDWPFGESTQTREPIVIPLYGPVFDSLPSTGGPPVLLERQDTMCGSPCPPPWVSFSSSDYLVLGQGEGAREV